MPTDIMLVIDRLSIIDALVRVELECVFFASVYFNKSLNVNGNVLQLKKCTFYCCMAYQIEKNSRELEILSN